MRRRVRGRERGRERRKERGKGREMNREREFVDNAEVCLCDVVLLSSVYYNCWCYFNMAF